MRSKLMMIDLAGGLVVLGLLLTDGWLAFLRDRGGLSEIVELRASISDSKSRLFDLNERLADQEERVRGLQAEADTTGRLPEQIPIEEDLQSIDTLAKWYDVEVTRLLPLASMEYAGLKEQRYSLEASGKTLNLLAFFRAIEEADFWADIGYLKIEAAPSNQVEPTNKRVASLVISMFLAAPPTEPTTGQKKG